MLVVMHEGREVGGHLLPLSQGLALHDTTMAQQHVTHLHH